MPIPPETAVQAHIPQSPGVYPHNKRRPKKPGVRLSKLMLSTYFRIGLTFLLLIMLFLTASFIAFQSEQKRKKLEEYEKQIPGAEILIPQKEEASTNQPTEGEGCIVSGCNNEFCQDADEEPLSSICIYQPEFGCYQSAICKRQANGKCDWTQTEALISCLAQYQENE